ncbi:MAG: DoxX family protein [Rhodothermaceae bacterium]|nr:DoxX family protein [Rhodothermaceae bacterium]MBC14576.1 DoxX family protein [Rhodothermaceae bacterium]
MRPVHLGRWVLALGFVAAGALHVIAPSVYDPAMPPWVPLPRVMILISGVAEVAGGVGLMQRSPHLRRWAGWGLVALLVAVYPANIWMAMAEIGGPAWLLWGRLPLQGALIAAVLVTTGTKRT